MKKIAAITALVLMLILVLSACGSKIEGTWSLTDAKSSSSSGEDMASAIAIMKAFGGDVTFTFDDGKATMKMNFMGQSQVETASYKTSGNKLILTSEDGEKDEMTYKVSGKTLTLTQGSDVLTFTKK